MATYREIDFEEHIEAHLLASGYHQRAPEDYDKDLCLIPDEVIAFIQTTQPKAYAALEKQYGSETSQKLLERIAKDVSRLWHAARAAQGRQRPRPEIPPGLFQTRQRDEPRTPGALPGAIASASSANSNTPRRTKTPSTWRSS